MNGHPPLANGVLLIETELCYIISDGPKTSYICPDQQTDKQMQHLIPCSHSSNGSGMKICLDNPSWTNTVVFNT